MAAEGLRVIAVASAEEDADFLKFRRNPRDGSFASGGLIGLSDPPRPGISEDIRVQECRHPCHNDNRR